MIPLDLYDKSYVKTQNKRFNERFYFGRYYNIVKKLYMYYIKNLPDISKNDVLEKWALELIEDTVVVVVVVVTSSVQLKARHNDHWIPFP